MRKLLVPVLIVNAALLGVLCWQEFPGAGAGRDPAPEATENGDANGDGARDIGDAVYLLSWLFQGGPEPVAFAAGPECAACDLSAGEIFAPFSHGFP
jgi:hypothetical protein